MLTAAGLTLFLGMRVAGPPPRTEGAAFRPELQVVLPAPVAASLAGGDPYLAADLAVVRAMVVATHLDDARQERLFGRLLDTASRLHPAHADGYYLAQALLPWSGQVALAQGIQERAARARPWDWLPAFFRAFNIYYFGQRPGAAAEQLRAAAERAPPGKRPNLEAMAARWSALGRDPQEARRLLEAMLAGTRHEGLRQEIRARLEQVRGLLALRDAAEAFRAAHGRDPRELAELVDHGGLEALPEDPFGEGYQIDERGRVVVRPPRPLRDPESVRP